MGNKNTRRHYRIIYPVGDKAEAVWNGHKLFITDLSESGISLEMTKGVPNAEVSKRHEITVYLLNGASHRSKAKLIRVSDDEKFVFTFDEPVPYSSIMLEQRFLIEKYGTLLDA